MKVLIAGSNSIHLSSYLEALKGNGLSVDFLAEEICGFEGVEKEYVISFRQLNPLAIYLANRKLHQLLATVKPSLVHIHQVNRMGYFVARQCHKLNIPVLTTAWGSDVLVVPKQNAFFRFLVRKTLERSQVVTADSQEMIAAMKTLHSGGEYVHLQYGIDLVDPAQKEKIIYSNRLHKPLYRIDKIIGYFDDFRKDHPDWSLVIGAVGTETEALKALVHEKGMEDQVQFVGWLEKEDNRQWYAKAAIYISIPRHDGTAVSLLEAMSAGCVPVVPDLPVSREWIEDGVNGVIEKQGQDPLREALSVDPVECANRNRKLTEEKASRQACIKRFLEIYRRIEHD